MRSLSVSDAETVIRSRQDGICRTEGSRYDHRLPGFFPVAQGMSARQVGRLLGDSTRGVQHWVRPLDEAGLLGLARDVHTARPIR